MDWRQFGLGDLDALDVEAADKLQRIQEVSQTLLYEDSTLSTLEAVILLLNLFRGNNATNALMDQAFALHHRVLLPHPNTLPDSEYLALQMLTRLGLEYELIEACPNNCILYRGAFSKLSTCLSCGASKKRRHGNSWVSLEIVCHFPLVKRLKRIFRM